MITTEVIKTITEYERFKAKWEFEIDFFSLISDRFQDVDVILSFFKLNDKSVKPMVVVCYEYGNLISFTPFYIKQQLFSWDLGVMKLAKFDLAILRLLGDKPLIFIPEKKLQVFEAIKKTLVNHKKDYDLALLDNVPMDCSILWDDILANKKDLKPLKVRALQSEPEIIRLINFPETYDQYISELSYKSRTNYRKAYEKFCKQCDDNYEFKEFLSSDDVVPFFDQLDDIYKKSWQAQTKGYTKRNTSEAIQLHQTIAQKKMFLGYILYIADKPIAFILGYLVNQTFLHFEIGFDGEYRKQQPGKVLEWLLIKKLYQDHEVRLLDYDTGENDYKKILGNNHIYCNKLYIYDHLSKARVIISIQVILRKCYVLIHRVLVKNGIDNKVRGWLKNRN